MFGFDDYAIGIVTEKGRMVFVRIARPADMPDEMWETLASGLCRILSHP